jgi:hypothetical protein
MKTLIIAISLYCTVCLLACQDSKEELKSPGSSKQDFYKNIGEKIPLETAMEWIELYKKTRNSTGRVEEEPAFVVSASEMDAMLASVADLTGVAFHYALDDAGTLHILVIPVDATLHVWPGVSGRYLIDANTGSRIAEGAASAWSENYKKANPDGIWYHFFGSNIFDDMKTLSYYQSVDIERATNTTGLTPELLLIVWNELSTGRTTADDGTTYDASNPCPPCE